jgi:hypothetical protein
MAAPAKSQNSSATGIFNAGTSEVNVGDASTSIAHAGLGEDPFTPSPPAIAPPSSLSAARRAANG